MLVENISMIWLTTESGIWPPSMLASVAAYSEELMSRERISTRRSSSAGALLGDELVALAGDGDGLELVLVDRDGGAQGQQQAVFVGFGLDALAGLQAEDAARQLVGADEGCGLLVFDAEAGEHGAQRVAGADAFFVDELLLVLLQRGDLVGQVRQLQVLRDGFDRHVGGVRRDRGDCGRAEGAQGQGSGAPGDDAGFAARVSQTEPALAGDFLYWVHAIS